MRRLPIALTVLVLGAAVVPALGHVPEVGGDDETVVDDPSVSRVFYRSVHGGESHVYRLEVGSRDDLVVGLQSPRATDAPPTATVTGPGVDAALGGPTGAASYEPFAPDVLYHVARLRRDVDAGTYTVTVRGDGPYALVVGEAERFTAVEWLATGVAVPRTRLWAGRWWLLAPALPVLATAAVWLRRRDVRDPPGLLAGTAGALCLGTAAATATALLWAATVTAPGAAALVAVALATLQGGVGAALLHRAPSAPDRRWRLATAVLGVLGAVVWAGAVLGPALAVLAAVAPGGDAGDGDAGAR